MQTNGLRIAKAVLPCLAALMTAAHAASGCLSPSAWTSLEQQTPGAISAAKVMDEMAKRDVVLLGEYHDDADHHRWQLQVLSDLYLLRPDMVIGFEMFPRRVQPALDRWVAGELTVKQFLEQSDWSKVWNTSPELYLPLFQFARLNRIPMIALNVENALNKAVREKGWDAVPDSQREGLGKPAAPSDDYRNFLLEIYRMHLAAHGKAQDKVRASDPGFRRFVESQTTWDRAMAEALAQRARPAQASAAPLVVGIIGAGHVRFGRGVAHQLRDLGIRNVGALLAVEHDADCKEIRNGLASAVFTLPPQAQEKQAPPRLGVRLDDSGDAVRIVDVSAGSLAEQTGLKADDRLLEVGGAPVKAAAQVAQAVRSQPAGTWLPIRIRRGAEALDIVVKFPVNP